MFRETTKWIITFKYRDIFNQYIDECTLAEAIADIDYSDMIIICDTEADFQTIHGDLIYQGIDEDDYLTDIEY